MSRDELATQGDHDLFELLKYVSKDQFYSKQLSLFSINRKNEIEIYPQVTKQTILFGTTESFHEKLQKLMIFYKRVLPVKGWNTYSKINVEYKNQIICK